MEIHFYESMNVVPFDKNIIYDWQSMSDLLKYVQSNRDNHVITSIHTTQMCMLSTSWILAGYRMFVHQDNGITYEIALDGTGDRVVRIAQNVYAMWASNVFRE